MKYRNLTTFILLFSSGLLFYCYEFYLRLLTGAFEAQIVEHFGIASHLSFSFLISSYNIIYLLMQIPAGILLDRFGSQKVLTIATLICGFGNIFFVWNNSYSLALFGRLLVGLGSSFAFVGVLKISREYLPARYFALFASITISLGTLAAAFSQQISVLLLSYHISFVTIFSYSGIIAVPLALYFFTILGLPYSNVKTELIPDASNISANFIKIIKNKYIWFNSIWGGLFYVPTVVLTSQYGVAYFTSLYGATAYSAAQAITALLMGWVVCSPLMSFLADLIHNVKKIVAIAGILAMLMLFLMTFFPAIISTRFELLFAAFLLGSFFSGQVLVWHVFNTICPKNLSALGIACTNMIITGVTEIGQLSSGLMLDWHEGSRIFALMTGFFLPMQFDALVFFIALVSSLMFICFFY